MLCLAAPQLLVLGNHTELIQLCVMSIPHTPLVLGYPWLKIHNLHIDWASHKIATWRPFWHSQCLQSAPFPVQTSSAHKSVSPPDLSCVLKGYHDLEEVAGHLPSASSSIRLRHRPPPWRSPSYQSVIQPVPSWERNYGNLHPWVTQWRYHLLILFSCQCWFLFSF